MEVAHKEVQEELSVYKVPWGEADTQASIIHLPFALSSLAHKNYSREVSLLCLLFSLLLCALISVLATSPPAGLFHTMSLVVFLAPLTLPSMLLLFRCRARSGV